MRLQIDFDSKVVKLCDTVSLEKFFEKIKEILPDGLWKSFSLNQVENVYYNSYPIWYWGSPTWVGTKPNWEPSRWTVTSSDMSGTITAGAVASSYNLSSVTNSVPNLTNIVNIEVEE